MHKLRDHARDVVIGLTDVTRRDARRQRSQGVIGRDQAEAGLTGSDGRWEVGRGSHGKVGSGSHGKVGGRSRGTGRVE